MLSEDRIREICTAKIPIIEKARMRESEKRQLWIYGAGIGGAIIWDVLNRNGMDIAGFIDKRAAEIQQLSAKRVVTIDYVNPKDDFIIISLRGYDPAVVDLCKEHGFSAEDIYYLAAGEDFNKEDTVYRGCRIGRYTYGYQQLLESCPLAESIGRFCSINETARIWNNHPLDYVSTHPFLDHPIFYPWEEHAQRGRNIFKYGRYFENAPFEDSPLRKNPAVVIGNDVWIGANVIILPGVHVGNGAVLAAGSIVVHDVAPYAIVGGNTAKVIRYRYTEKQIEQFQKIEWWNWDIQKIEENYELFLQPELFLNIFGT